jgi:hypothetical protein
LQKNKVTIQSILQLLPGLLANYITDIPKLPHFDEGTGKKFYEEKLEQCVSMAIKHQMRLASAFHEHMTKGQTYHAPNSNRETFYKQVIELAKEVNFLSFAVFVRMTGFSSLWKAANQLKKKMDLSMASTF